MGQACSACLNSSNRNRGYEPLLSDGPEHSSLADLLQYIETLPINHAGPFTASHFYSGAPLRVLSDLCYSRRVETQRSGAFAFAEITEKEPQTVSRDVLDPLIHLLHCHDDEVQRAASAALGNLAVIFENKHMIIELGALPPLIQQMKLTNVEVQCNAVGCITNLATDEPTKMHIAASGALRPLVQLAGTSSDIRVQRNACGALLNMTHTEEIREYLVKGGAIPVLISLLDSNDVDVQYYVTTALSNLAVDQNTRELLETPAYSKLLPTLLDILSRSSASRLVTQSTLAMRNLASSPTFQSRILRAHALPLILRNLEVNDPSLVLASVACLRNLSICEEMTPETLNASVENIRQGEERANMNWRSMIQQLIDLVEYELPSEGVLSNSLSMENLMVAPEIGKEVQCHAISTLRNLAAGDDKCKHLITELGLAERIRDMLYGDLYGWSGAEKTPEPSPGETNGESADSRRQASGMSHQLKSDVTAVIAVLGLCDELKEKLLKIDILSVLVPLGIREGEHPEVQGNVAAAIGNLATKVKDYTPFHPYFGITTSLTDGLNTEEQSIPKYLVRFLQSEELAFRHIAVHNVVQFLEGNDEAIGKRLRAYPQLMELVKSTASGKGLPVYMYDDAEKANGLSRQVSRESNVENEVGLNGDVGARPAASGTSTPASVRGRTPSIIQEIHEIQQLASRAVELFEAESKPIS